MLFDIGVDAYVIVRRIFYQWVYGRGLYINELMASKLPLLGWASMLITVTLQSRERRKSTPGLLNQAEERSARVSLALLFGRLMMSVLFLYVGLSELHRLLFQPYTPYLPGDGHDVVWPKAVELLLAAVTKLLAASLVLEAFRAVGTATCRWHVLDTSTDTSTQAFYAWSWRAIHYREHFMTNVATAGGLLLLVKLGGGRYTVDELVKKKD
ncbi:hypothetical protein EMIHUDRAFT_201100 [Emiliania huxleyi CCMP1516]|uniref:Uncharacterized protein n=2 Tax=Emiliania huxleyi TaxID=2903 RepID=A0A0D3KM57_EMIH1|nr:hypothetical protein EMIHUDRAFT_201100 [Emiliania huxleyi CCMP1516]EOD36842.1 hypothetical protein EMIHUDRAFT_201100 [Emiliania huxleyi CCMP1516]|eukprot:XP_005789271.1 hypothetical protein EMIHUDRAFT_201100 [Emiliania huxleyi CCMP1516]